MAQDEVEALARAAGLDASALSGVDPSLLKGLDPNSVRAAVEMTRQTGGLPGGDNAAYPETRTPLINNYLPRVLKAQAIIFEDRCEIMLWFNYPCECACAFDVKSGAELESNRDLLES